MIAMSGIWYGSGVRGIGQWGGDSLGDQNIRYRLSVTFTCRLGCLVVNHEI